MKRVITTAMVLAAAITAQADVTVNFPTGTTGEYELESQLVSDALKPRSERPKARSEIKEVKNGQLKFDVLAGGAAQYFLVLSDNDAIRFYSQPGENITVNVKSLSPLEYSFSGTALMEGISEMRPKANAIENEYRMLSRSENPDQSKMQELIESYNKMFKDYIAQNPNNPTAVYAALQLDGEDYMSAYEGLSEEAKKSALYPFAVKQAEVEAKNIAAAKHMQELTSGNVAAPVFTLKNLDGNDVTLSDYKGKWVVLDFWGSWCPWCIKGFPKLKEAYAEYAGKMEVIGVDCNDTAEKWRDAVKKYELPWVNVYNGEPGSAKILEDYAVTGFPTKVIVNPEGKIANITVGEDPSFFEKLSAFINGK